MSRAVAMLASLSLLALAPVAVRAQTAPAPVAAHAAPDVIYANAKVLTVNPGFEIAEAVAVKDGRIQAVGSTATIRALAGPATKVIDLGGKPLLPGFADNHAHLGGPIQPWKYGGWIGELPEWIKHADTIPEVLEAIRGQAAKLPKGSWIVGELAREQWPNGTLPGRADFDKVAPDHPVAIARGPHTLLVNSKALELAKITKDTTAEGGEIVHGPDGEPNGKILESARRLVWDVMPPETREGGGDKEARLVEWRKLLNQLTALGITSMNVPGIRPNQLKDVQELYDRWGDEFPRASVQVRLWPGYDHHADPEVGVKESIAEIDALPDDPSTFFTHPKLKLLGVKMSIDGGLSAPIMWTTKPYENRPGFHGEQRIPDSVFYRVAKRVHEKGWQLGIHTMGDGAVTMVVDQLERIYRETGKGSYRDYLHHIAVMPSEATMQKMARLGINLASQPGFLLALGSYADEALAPEDEAHQDPARTMLKHGIRVSFGSDAGPWGPIAALYAAVTRRGWNDEVHGPEEALSVAEAIKAHTIEPAYFNFDEKVRGSIEPGKVADLVVLDRDPLAVDPVRLQDIKVERTIIGGREVYVSPATVAGK